MKGILFRSTLFATVAFMTLFHGCRTASPHTAADAKPAVALKPFSLQVCNQSQALSPIDIRIEIDGKVVVHEDFEVGRQLNWKRFALDLPQGEHAIRISSRKGEAELMKKFSFHNETGASVQYWYYPATHRFAISRHFRFTLHGDSGYHD